MEDVKKQIHALKANLETAEDLAQLGDLYAQNHDLLEARHYYERAIEEFPDNYVGFLKLGEFALQQKNYFDANNYFSDALKRDQTNLSALLGMIRVHIHQAGLERAEFFVKRALKHYPDHIGVALYAGIVYFHKHDLFFAEKYLNRAVELSPDPKDKDPKSTKSDQTAMELTYLSYTRFYLGLLNSQKGLYQAAFNDYNWLVSKEPFAEANLSNYCALWNNIGVVHYRMGDYEYAIKAFQKIVEKGGPAASQTWLNLAMVYWAQDDLDKAMKAFEQAHSREPTLFPWLNELKGYTKHGNEFLKAKVDNFIKENPDGVNIGLYLGCVIPNRYPFIDAATRHVLNKLNVGVKELEGAGCCPAPGVFRSFDINTWLTLGARNLTIGEDIDRNVCIMCNGCYGTLNDINTELKHDEKKRDYVNSKLAEIGKEFKGTIEAEHLVWVLYNDIGVEQLKQQITRKLGLKVAVHYGCHIIKPIHNKPWKDSFEKPEFLDELVELTGCESVDYRDKLMCCGAGGGLRGSEKEISLDFTRDKLESMRKAGVDIIVDCCPFCHLQLDLGQMEINSIFKDQISAPFSIPVIYISQLLGLAMGIDPFSLGLLRYPQKKGVPPFTPVDPIFTRFDSHLNLP
jgi:heterodisulfide reductase subunit B2